jgi:hypothetical protein
MFEVNAMKATLTTSDGVKIEYMPAAILMVEDEQYLVMRAEVGHLIEEEVLLLRIEQDGEGMTLHVVEDRSPFANAIEDSLGESKRVH